MGSVSPVGLRSPLTTDFPLPASHRHIRPGWMPQVFRCLPATGTCVRDVFRVLNGVSPPTVSLNTFYTKRLDLSIRSFAKNI